MIPERMSPMFIENINTSELSLSDVAAAKRIFDDYRAKGTVLGGAFDDAKWLLTSEYQNYGLVFKADKDSYDRYYKDFFDMTFEEFELYEKTFIMFSMGKWVLDALQYTLTDIKNLIDIPPDDIISEAVVPTVSSPARVTEFLTMIPCPNEEKIDLIIDSIEREYDRRMDAEHPQRELAAFDSYFLFRDIIDDFWENETDEELRLFYAPLYFWWHITGIIPMRPREFLLTPRDCLKKKADGYWLTLRKDLLKGRSTKQVGYRIDEDFKTVTYQINDELGRQIQRYIDDTSKFASTQLNTLFIPDIHYRHWKQKKHSNSRYYTYVNLRCCLRYFYNDIISGRYGIRVVERSETHLQPGTINYIYLGDTRHISLINVIMEGGTPSIAMVLAGHTDVEMESWYASNLTKYVECATYREYRKVIKGKVEFTLSTAKKMPPGRDYTTIDNGRCYSRKRIDGDYSDCLKATGPHGEIACCPVCGYYSKNRETYVDNYSHYKKRVTDDCTYIGEIVKQYRSGKGEKEDVLRACLKLKDTLFSYKDFCRERGLEDGGEKED